MFKGVGDNSTPFLIYLLMSVTINQVISLLAERSGKTFDIPFQEELKIIADYWISTILKQAIEKRPQDRYRFQTSIVLELERVPEIECPIEYGCVLRTKKKVPTPSRGTNTIFDYIGSADFKDSWDRVTQPAFLQYLSCEPVVGQRPKPVYKNDYIYLYGHESKEVKYIGVQGVFTDFSKLRELQCDSLGCFEDDVPYPVTNDIIQQAIQAILSTELRLNVVQEDTNIEAVNPTNSVNRK